MTSQSFRPTRFHRCILVLVLLVPLCLSDSADPPQPAVVPDHHTHTEDRPTVDSLPLPVQYTFSSDLGRLDPVYHLQPDGSGGYVAANLAGLTAILSPSGMHVRATAHTWAHTWSLALIGWGRGDEVRPLAQASPGQVKANRLEYARDTLTEWYANGPLGLQQGWTLTEPPAGGRGGLLSLVLTQGGSLHGRVGGNGATSLALADAAGVDRLRYGGLMAYDATGRGLPAWFEADGEQVLIRVDDAGAVYPVTVDPWVEACKLTTPQGTDGEYAGQSVAVSADGSTVVVGVPYYGAGSTAQGAVYVYVRPGTWASTPLYSARLVAGDGAGWDWLGTSVAVSDDGSTVVAGAPGRNAGGSDRGAAYVFVRSGADWVDATHVVRLTAGVATNYEKLGTSVAISGDGTTIIAGAPGDEVVGNDQGAAHIYVRPSGGWANAIETARLTVADMGAHRLGTSVAVSDDGGTVVCGAPGYKEGIDMGAAYIYLRPGGGWADATETARLTSGDGQPGDWLGVSVAVSGAGDVVVAGAPWNGVQTIDDHCGAVYLYALPGDGWTTTMSYAAKLTASDCGDGLGWSVAVSGSGKSVFAGAPFHERVINGKGAVYVFAQDTQGWNDDTEAAKLTATDGVDGDRIGESMAVSGDGGTVIAGSTKNDAQPGGSDRGAAYVFVKPGSAWANTTETAKLTAGAGAQGDLLGQSVAISGDGSTVVAGAPLNPAGGIKRGAAYVYMRPAGGWTATATFSARLTAGDGADDDEFGSWVAVNSDGSTVVVGAPGHPGGGKQGAVYVFTRPSGGWVTITAHDAKLTASDAADDDELGHSVAVSGDGDTVVAGAPWNNAVYVYARPGSGWAHANQTAKLTMSDGESNDKLGYAVAVSEDGDLVVAGAPSHETSTCIGAAYVYTRVGTVWTNKTETAKLTADGGSVDAELGKAVAASGDGGTIVVGAPESFAAGLDGGAACVFIKPTGGWVDAIQTATLFAGDSGSGDVLGAAVAVSDDGTIVVAGARSNDGAGPGWGAVYVFGRPAGGWIDGSYTAKLTMADGVDEDRLGSSVAMSGDGHTIVAGAPSRTWTGGGVDGLGAVHAYVFTAPPTFTSGQPPSPATVGTPYNHTFAASGVPSPTFDVTDGSLPPGLTLDGCSGALSGTPTTPGTYTFTVTASNGVLPDATQQVTIEVQSDKYLVYLPIVLRNVSGN